MQALSIKEHRSALIELCGREGAQNSINGLTPVNKDVVATVFDMVRWDRTNQLIRICKPLVDIIGDVESRDSTLADCMLQLIYAHREVNRVPHKEGDDPEFAAHARSVLNTQFHAMNTDIHWFALFLHPLCRKLAISLKTHSWKLEDAFSIALDLAKRWGWTKEMATKLTFDIKTYSSGSAPFAGGKGDGKQWWTEFVPPTTTHPIKAMALKIFSIIPHAAEVERFFSCLGGVQSAKQLNLTVTHMTTFGTLRNHYTQEVHAAILALGKSTRRKHAHMHTQALPGIDVARAEDLIKTYMWTLLANTAENAVGSQEESASISPEDINAEFARLDAQGETDTQDGDRLPANVAIDQVYNLTSLDEILGGSAPLTVEEELDVAKTGSSGDDWDPASLLRSLGVK